MIREPRPFTSRESDYSQFSIITPVGGCLAHCRKRQAGDNKSRQDTFVPHAVNGSIRSLPSSMRLSILVTLGLSALVHAFSDEPPKDWHKALAGIPLTQYRALAPRFHRRLEGRSSHSHIYVATEKNTLAAIYPNNGTLGESKSIWVIDMENIRMETLMLGPSFLAWRQSFDPLDHLVNFKAHSHCAFTFE